VHWWCIYFEGDRGWMWQCTDQAGGVLARASLGFRDHAECLVDARRHGYPNAPKGYSRHLSWARQRSTRELMPHGTRAGDPPSKPQQSP
jgi:hypothetical protein